MANYFIDLKYTKLLGARLLNFKQKKADLFVFSHSCEDRTSRRVKARAFFYSQGGAMYVKCHHCGMSHRLSTFLAMESPVLADEYRIEVYREKLNSGEIAPPLIAKSPEPIKEEPKKERSVLDGLVRLTDLRKDHPALQYVKKRAIPAEHYDRLFFCSKFHRYASRFNDSFKNLKDDHPRLILPYFDKENHVFALTARAFGREEKKYIFLQIEEKTNNIYGLWRIDPQKPIIAVEGQIDSLCLDNAIAVGGADYSSEFIRSIKSNLIIVPDNDFVRNKQVADSVQKAIDSGYTVSLFPPSFKCKDVNEALQKNFMSKEELLALIKNNAKSGAEAKLELIFRRKC